MDVDSTLIQQEVIELLADHAGLMPEVRAITELAMTGEIDFQESLTKRVKLLKGLPVDVFYEVRQKISFTTGAPELVEAVHALGGRIGAVSGGFSQILGGLAHEVGLDYWKANELEVEDGELTGRLIGEMIDAQAKATALRQWADDFGLDIADTVAIGDGANDIPMLQAAGLAVAFRPKQVLRQYADIVIEENSLVPLIERLQLRSS
ncbi:unannotated protein [freshwater metagenome]|uniref:phosphoserine phosphatase n=1 Tax=freshwater metagenome TaxID=449393 RepID=A0A6J6IVY3_9ZZZZ|nr:phosphoserine phosphatase SerB [Actinomycetota bacterium]